MKARANHWVGVLFVALVGQVIGAPSKRSLRRHPRKTELVVPVRKPLSCAV